LIVQERTASRKRYIAYGLRGRGGGPPARPNVDPVYQLHFLEGLFNLSLHAEGKPGSSGQAEADRVRDKERGRLHAGFVEAASWRSMKPDETGEIATFDKARRNGCFHVGLKILAAPTATLSPSCAFRGCSGQSVLRSF
jgi:hypothetical protein